MWESAFYLALNMYRYDFVGFADACGTFGGCHGCRSPYHQRASYPSPADDIDAEDFKDAISDEIFEKIVAVLRIAVPYTGMIISTKGISKQENAFWIWVFLS